MSTATPLLENKNRKEVGYWLFFWWCLAYSCMVWVFMILYSTKIGTTSGYIDMATTVKPALYKFLKLHDSIKNISLETFPFII